MPPRFRGREREREREYDMHGCWVTERAQISSRKRREREGAPSLPSPITRRQCKITSVIESNERGELALPVCLFRPELSRLDSRSLPPSLRPSPPRSHGRPISAHFSSFHKADGLTGGRAHALHAAHTPPPARSVLAFRARAARGRGGELAGHGGKLWLSPPAHSAAWTSHGRAAGWPEAWGGRGRRTDGCS